MKRETTAHNIELTLSPAQRKSISKIQDDLVTEAAVYKSVSAHIKSSDNAKVLKDIADDKKRLAAAFAPYTNRNPEINTYKVRKYTIIARTLGFTFAVKLLERNKRMNREINEVDLSELGELDELRKQEETHDKKLLSMLDEEMLSYVGSMVLGMNDAMVEMSGTLAGLTLAMQNTRLIALSGLITGIAATLSMAASEYLSTKSSGDAHPVKSSLYTGVTYLVTVALLILPYLLYDNTLYLWAMFTMIATMIVILVAFNLYLSVAKDLSFKKRFGQMATISLGVSALSFVLGIVVKAFLGVDV